MKRVFARISILITFITFTITVSYAGDDKNVIRYGIVDNHIHYLDFTQKTDGFTSLIQAMDKAGVEKAVVFGMPMVKMWTDSDPVRPAYYMDTDSPVYYYSGTDFILANDLAKQPPAVQKR